jgi:DNA-binding NarL/FixJ family response regulator
MKSAPSKKVIVWLIEDNDIFRATTMRLINYNSDLHCPHSFSSCEDALAALASGPAPQIIISDVGLPGINGIEGIARIKDLAPATQVIILTVYEEHQKVFDAICAGASGYLLKNSLEATLATAIRDVLQGGAPMTPRVAKFVLEKFARISSSPKNNYGLSAREKEILELMARGKIIKIIADELSLSAHTVNNHLRNIYAKLHVHTRSGAVAKALRENII